MSLDIGTEASGAEGLAITGADCAWLSLPVVHDLPTRLQRIIDSEPDC